MLPLRSLALLLALPLTAVAAQPAAQAPVRVSVTSVSRVTLLRINPGQAAAFNRDVVDNLIPVYEAYKKAGIIVGYSFFNKSTTDDEGDWQRGITLTYANWAALDGLAAKTDPITLQHFGTAERRTAAQQARAANATTVSAFYTTAVTYTR